MKTSRTALLRKARRRGLAAAAGTVAMILLLAGAVMWLGAPLRPDTARIGGPFTLVADDGRTVTDRSFPGKYLAVYFGYTACEDICPQTLNTLTSALSHMGQRGALIQPLFVTIDPARDTPAVLHKYVSAFSPDLIGLSGSAAAMRRVGEEYRVASTIHHEPNQAGLYTMDHTSVIYLMSPEGSFLAPIQADAPEPTMISLLSEHVT